MSTAASPSVKHNGITDRTVREQTGRTWPEWFGILDAASAMRMNHAELGAYLHHQQNLSEWWSQMVAVAYERARGMRDKNQSCTGERSVSVSKTILAPVQVVYGLCAAEKSRPAWLAVSGVTTRKANENKNIRAMWPDGSSVELRFTAKPGDKCQIVADHMKLKDAAAVDAMRAFWSEALAVLKTLAESTPADAPKPGRIRAAPR